MRLAAVREKIKNRIKCSKGMTMVELIVTFALLAIFLVAATQLITASMQIYHHVRSADYGKQVTDTLLDKIAGEVEGAQVASTVISDTGSEGNEQVNRQDKTLIVSEDHVSIDLYDRTGSRVKISVNDNSYLNIYYYPVYSDSTSGIIRYEDVNWTFDEAAYMGFKVETLQFSIPGIDNPGVYDKNVIKVDMTIKSGRYGEYSATRYVRCYNFITDDDMSRIEGPGDA